MSKTKRKPSRARNLVRSTVLSPTEALIEAHAKRAAIHTTIRLPAELDAAIRSMRHVATGQVSMSLAVIDLIQEGIRAEALRVKLSRAIDGLYSESAPQRMKLARELTR